MAIILKSFSHLVICFEILGFISPKVVEVKNDCMSFLHTVNLSRVRCKS